MSGFRTILQHIKCAFDPLNGVPDHLRPIVKEHLFEIMESMRIGMSFEEACEDWDILIQTNQQMDKFEVTEEIVRRFNTVRSNNAGKEFDRAEMMSLLRGMGFPGTNDTTGPMLQAMCDGKNPPIVRTGRGVYMFNKEPVYKERIRTAVGQYRILRSKTPKTKTMQEKLQDTFPNKQLFKQPRDQQQIQKQSVPIKERLDQAIKLLKEYKYKIYKPTVNYEEI